MQTQLGFPSKERMEIGQGKEGGREEWRAGSYVCIREGAGYEKGSFSARMNK